MAGTRIPESHTPNLTTSRTEASTSSGIFHLRTGLDLIRTRTLDITKTDHRARGHLQATGVILDAMIGPTIRHGGRETGSPAVALSDIDA